MPRRRTDHRLYIEVLGTPAAYEAQAKDVLVELENEKPEPDEEWLLTTGALRALLAPGDEAKAALAKARAWMEERCVHCGDCAIAIAAYRAPRGADIDAAVAGVKCTCGLDDAEGKG